MKWIEGTPSEPGTYWVELYDQGGWPFVMIASLRHYYKKECDLDLLNKQFQKSLIEAEKADPNLGKVYFDKLREFDDVRDKQMEIQYIIPHESGMEQEWQPITSLWNCSRYIKLEPPKTKYDYEEWWENGKRIK